MSIRIERAGRGFRLTAETRLPQPIDRVFPFFADARNLNRLTPARVRFEILTPGEIPMATGTLIDYRIRIRGVPVRWRTRIRDWDPPHGFIDEQLRGPYLWWVHRHTFEPDGETTIARDRVDYGVLGGAFVHGLFVRRDLEHIFAYRAEQMAEIFGAARPGVPAREPAAV
ncbi:MAG: CDP-paratose 2-epimerase [Phycisphaerales bacterium JB041]